MTITLSSNAFEAGKPIPQKHTADGQNLSPALTWSNLPEGTQQLALIIDDPDAPRDEPFVHWVLYGIPAAIEELPEGIPKEETLSEPIQGVQGTNDFGQIGYGGPAPPRGHGTHHYHFTLYALDDSPDLKAGLTKQDLLKAIDGHVLARGELVGTYER